VPTPVSCAATQNLDLRRAGSLVDACAVVGELYRKELGGLLSRKPSPRDPIVRNLPDRMLNVSAMM
jgi:hypothetical protein